MADATNKDVVKAIENLTGNMTKLLGAQGKNVSVGRTPNSSSNEKTPTGNRLYSQIEKEIKKPDTPLKKAIVKMLETTWGRAVGQMIIQVKSYTQDYYRRMTSIVSGFARKIFGSLMDELDPFIEAIKATGSYLLNMLKTIPKFIGTIKNTLMSAWDGFKKIGEKIGGFFKPKTKADDPQTKELRKQTNIERKNLLIQGKIIRWLTYIEKNTARTASASGGTSAYMAARTGRFMRRYGRNMVLPDVGGGGGTSSAPAPAQGILGKAWSGLKGIGGGILSLFGGATSLIGTFFPVIGTIAKIVMAVAGVSLLAGLWKRFLDTKTGQKVKEWVSNLWYDTLKPFIKDDVFPMIKNFWNDTLWPLIKSGAYEMGSLMWEGFKWALLGTPHGEIAKRDVSVETQTAAVELAKQKILTEEDPVKKATLQTIIDEGEKNRKSLEKSKEEEQKNLDKTITWSKLWYPLANVIAGAAAGVATGAMIGAAAGTVVPVAGNVFGGLVGAGLGGYYALSRKEGGTIPNNSEYKNGGLAVLHGGEGVLNAGAMNKIGEENLNILNSGKIPKFQDGGLFGKIENMFTSIPGGNLPFLLGIPQGIMKDSKIRSNKERSDAWDKMRTSTKLPATTTAPTTAPISLPKSTTTTMSSTEVKSLLQQTFGDQWKTAASVMMAESGGYTDAVNYNNKPPGISTDYGLFQINSKYWKDRLEGAGILKKGEDMSVLFDPKRNIEAAKFVYDKSGGWGAWYLSQKNWGGKEVPDSALSVKTGWKKGLGASPYSGTGGTGDTLMDFVSSIWDMTKAIGSALWEEAFGPSELMSGPDTSQGKAVVTSETARSKIPAEFAEAISQPMKEQGVPTIINQVDNSSNGGNGVGPVVPPPYEHMLGMGSKAYLLRINTNTFSYK